MPAQIACPISEVDRALASYINSREETLRIRRTLTKYVTSSLRPVTAATQSQHLNHECPNLNITAVPTNPPGLKDLRLQYLQALRAHNQAQTRHGQILDTLSDLHQQHMDENPTQPQQSDHDNDTTRSYITLLHQRRRLAELQVIQDSLEKLLNAKPLTTGKDPKAMVKDSIGEQPDLPVERLEQISQANDDQTWVFKLKQEVLDARASMDHANGARSKAQEQAPKQPSLQQQVYALECARHEIVEWVQGELSKLEEDSIFLEDVSPIKKMVPQAKTVDLQQAEQRIREAYDKYTQSRASLIESYERLQQPVQASTREDDPNHQDEVTSDQSKDDSKLSMPITKILPHLPHLTRTANYERSLLQQSVYLQSQIASADQEIEEALLRLSGESHLLPAGSKDVAAWGKAAAEAENATREFVKEHLESSRQEMSSVSTIVELCSLQSKVLASS